MYSVVPSNDVSAVSASDGSSGAFINGLSGFASDLELSMNKAFSFIFPFLMIFFLNLSTLKIYKNGKIWTENMFEFFFKPFLGSVIGY